MSEWILPAGGALGALAVLRVAAPAIARSLVLLVTGIYANVHPDEKRRKDSQRFYKIADRDRQLPGWSPRAAPMTPLPPEPPDPDEIAR
ncbi:hypothetical protein [Nocardia alni]|uniref:hypothetical protein n=1 Tax=Nocardia alni TaxID=2815723 RepID=UPI001C22EB28|nr:hypothetical protein [Nocardia alni]